MGRERRERRKVESEASPGWLEGASPRPTSGPYGQDGNTGGKRMAVDMPLHRSNCILSWWLMYRISLLKRGEPLTGEPDAGNPPVRFGGRGSNRSPYPYPP